MHIEQSDFHDHLVRGLAHKMNNILSLFHGYIGLLLDDKKLDRATLDGLNRIKEGAHAASDLMDRTKALATPSSTVWRQVDTADFLRTLLPALQLYAERGITVTLECDERLPELWVDTSRLRLALKEVVKNACEASPAKGEVRITAKTRTRQSRSKGKGAPVIWVAISVTDSGQGIAPEMTEKIFQPFFSTKGKRDAVGLGLSVALGLVQQLSGCIRLQSKPGKTTFRVLLPARAV